MQPKSAPRAADHDPRRHVQAIEARFAELIDRLRADIETIEEPRAKALFETSAEVLGGLKKAFADYQKRNEPAWR